MKKEILSLFIISLIAIISIHVSSASELKEFSERIIGLSPQEGELISHYKFENNLQDSVSSFDGIGNGISFAEGKFGQGVKIDSMEDYIAIADQNNFNYNEITVELWAKWGVLKDAWLIGKRYPYNPLEDNYGFLIRSDTPSNTVMWRTGNKEKGPSISSPINTNVWYHIVGTYNGETMELFINGVSQGKAILEGGINYDSVGDLIIGNAYPNKTESLYFDGILDEVKIYNKAITAAEVAAIYNPPIVEEVKETCTDSDEGKNYFTKGSITICAIKNSSGSCGTSADSCLSSLKLKELFCENDRLASQESICENGCENGACIKKDSNIECKDSDAGLIPGEKGIASGVTYNGNIFNEVTDKCTIFDENGQRDTEECVGENCRLTEWWCDEGEILRVDYNFDCRAGCKGGVCIQDEKNDTVDSTICQPLLDKLLEINEIYPGFRSIGKEFYEQDPDYWGTKAKFSIYNFENEEKSKEIIVATIVLEEGNKIEETNWFNSIKNIDLVSGDEIYVNGKNNKLYVLQYDETEKILFWYNENILVYILLGSKEEKNSLRIKNLEEFISNIQNNEFESIIDYSNSDYQLIRDVAYNLLTDCFSGISSVECIPRWERKVEPTICPEYGSQKIIIRDSYGCNDRIIESEKYCSPGICSGCYIPRWLGYPSRGDNICVPYSTRLGYEQEDKERLYTGEENDEVLLICKNSYEAELVIYNKKSDFNVSYNLIEGSSHVISEEIFGEEIKFRVDDIKCDDGAGYIDISLLNNFNAYCDIDGKMKKQKTKDREGSWASCQNNYECDSNLCSSGECIEINDAIKKAGLFKELFVKVACRISNLFNGDGYNECTVRYLGYSEEEIN
ncbi:MAG: LamG domain-containing protein [Nanoarchaeota archaeon]|nr:LamG domain-containing protein [Nanoarchaeota archaeon]